MRKTKVDDPVRKYAKDVISGKIVAGRLVKLACQRHIDDEKNQKKKRIEWRPNYAEDAIDFFENNLRLADGRPFVLEQFQKFIVGSIFGWFNSAGYRRFRTAYVESGKGSGKTPLAAGIGLYGLVTDSQEDPEAEIYSAAVTRDQAGIVFKDACNMATGSPELSEILRNEQNKNGDIEIRMAAIVFYPTRSTLRPVSSEHRGLDGKRVHMALIDELHEHPHALVVDKMRAGTKTRRNALIFEITNAGYDRTSVCWHHHEYSVKVLEGTEKNDNWFAYVCTLDEGDDWRDEKVWLKVNPGLDTILPKEYLREQVQEARGMPAKENIVKRLNFCVWTEQSTRWLDMDYWRKCSEPRQKEGLLGRECFGGLDLASTIDITAFLLFFPDDEGNFFDIVPRFWVPESSLEVGSRTHSEGDRLRLLEFARNGYIEITPGLVTDYSFIEKAVLDAGGDFQLREIAYDRWNASQTVTRLENEGAPMVKFSQGFAGMSAPSKQLERLVKLGAIRHGGHPVLEWMASNVSVKQDAAGNIKPDRESSGEKIDGIVALIMALGAWIRYTKEEEEGPSVYEERGPLVFGAT
jgi:phage terminase large subunit-like protein